MFFLLQTATTIALHLSKLTSVVTLPFSMNRTSVSTAFTFASMTRTSAFGIDPLNSAAMSASLLPAWSASLNLFSKQKGKEGTAGKARQGQQEAPRCVWGVATGKCDPDHKHHKGNDVADELANLGRAIPAPGTSYHTLLCGEERVHNGMVREGRVCKGDITEEIKAANRQRLQTTMREGKAHLRQLAEMLESSDTVMRHKVMKGQAVSTRFNVRAMSDSMPIVKHEWDKAKEGNAYLALHVWGSHRWGQVLVWVRGTGNYAVHNRGVHAHGRRQGHSGEEGRQTVGGKDGGWSQATGDRLLHAAGRGHNRGRMAAMVGMDGVGAQRGTGQGGPGGGQTGWRIGSYDHNIWVYCMQD